MTWPLAARPGIGRARRHERRPLTASGTSPGSRTRSRAIRRISSTRTSSIRTGTRCAYSDANLVAGAMAVPVYALTGNPIAAHNVVVFVALVLAFLATWQLVRRFTGDPWLALVPATGFAFSAFVSAHTAHIQLLMIFVVPVALLALPSVRRSAVDRAAAVGAGARDRARRAVVRAIRDHGGPRSSASARSGSRAGQASTAPLLDRASRWPPSSPARSSCPRSCRTSSSGASTGDSARG